MKLLSIKYFQQYPLLILGEIKVIMGHIGRDNYTGQTVNYQIGIHFMVTVPLVLTLYNQYLSSRFKPIQTRFHLLSLFLLASSYLRVFT
jgi:hypothetical protein